jgi:hypothetical protein
MLEQSIKDVKVEATSSVVPTAKNEANNPVLTGKFPTIKVDGHLSLVN